MGIFRFLGKLIALLLFVVFLVVLPATLWTYNLQRAMFERDTYRRIVENRSLYTVFLPEFASELIHGVEPTPEIVSDARRAHQVFVELSEEDWQTVAALITPADWLQDQIKYNIDALFAWVDGPHPVPEFRFELAEMKDRLAGEEGRQVVQLVVEKWPACSTSEEARLKVTLESEAVGTKPLPSCRPGDEALRAGLIEAFADSIAVVAGEIPDRLPEDLDAGSLTLRERTEWLNNKLSLRVIRRVSYLIFLLPITFLLLIEIFAVRSFRSLFRWYGWALFLGGLVSLLLLLPLTSFPLVAWRIMWGTGAVDPLTLPVIIGITNLLNLIAQPILFQGSGIMVVGLVFLGMASLFAGPAETKARKEQEAPDTGTI